MQYTILAKLVMEKGANNITIPETIKFQVLTEAGYMLFKENRYEESAKAFAKANNTQELLNAGDWLYQQGRFQDSAYYFQYIKDTKRIEACAHSCMNNNYPQEAKLLFTVLDNKNMLKFLNENFGI